MRPTLPLAALVVLSLLAHALSVDVPYTSCASATAHLNVTSVTSNIWPPEIDKPFTVNLTGLLNKAISAGSWTASIKVGIIPFPKISGNIDDFAPLPWAKGPFTPSYSTTVPSIAPSGSYQATITAEDQDSEQLFCAELSFKMSSKEGGREKEKEGETQSPLGALAARLQRVRRLGQLRQ